MNHAWKVCQQKETERSISPFELKDNYNSVQIEMGVNKQRAIIKDKNEGVLFLAQTLKEEVCQGTHKQQVKKLKELSELLIQYSTIATLAGVTSIFGMIIGEPHTASANPFMSTPSNTVPTTTEITPDSIMDWALEIALIIRSIGIGLGITMFSIVGIYIIVARKKTQEGIEWSTNIIKGAVQVIVSIPLIWALYQISQAVFSNLPFLEAISSK